MVYQNATLVARRSDGLEVSSAGTNASVPSTDRARPSASAVPTVDLMNVELVRIDLSRWCAPSMAWGLVATLVVQGLLFCSDRYEWGLFNKGFTVLVAFALTAVCLLSLGGYVALSCVARGRSQFSLATLLFIIPVAAFPCAWLARDIDVAQKKQAIVEALNRRKIEPLYSEDFSGIFQKVCSQETAAWLQSQLGREFFCEVTYVDMQAATDSDVKALAMFSELSLLALDRSAVTDTGLAHLEESKELQGISLIDAQVTDAGLEHLKKLPKLKWLFLAGTSVSDRGVKEFREASPQCIVVQARWWRRHW